MAYMYLPYNYYYFCTGTYGVQVSTGTRTEYRYEVKMYIFDCSYHTITITFVPYSVSIREPSYFAVSRGIYFIGRRRMLIGVSIHPSINNHHGIT